MLTLDKVSYHYRKGWDVIDSVSLDLKPSLHLLLGENGAGKTTLLHLMSSLLFPKSGTCHMDGEDLSLRLPSSLGRIFFLGDNFESPLKTIVDMSRHHGIFYPNFNYEMMYANLADFGLTGKEKLSDLSLGMRRKAYVAYALALGVDVLLLDEPANGMDIDSKKTLRRLLTRCLGDNQAIVVSTHNVHDIGNLFENILILHHGRLVLDIPVWELTEKLSFVTSPSPVDGCVYQEPEAGHFKAIIGNEDGLETDIDYQLLYSAVMSPIGPALVDFIKTYNPKSHE